MIWLLLSLEGARDVDTLIGSLQERKIAFVHIKYDKSIAGHVPYSVRTASHPAV
jgi:hypothetical protein